MNFDKQLDVFSRNLSEIRRNGRYSYQAFSEKLRVGKSTVQAIESGDYNITLSTLITIANSLEIHPALLLMDLPIELDLTGTNRYYANPRQPVWSGTYAPCSAHTGAPAASHYCRPSLRVRLPPVPRSVS